MTKDELTKIRDEVIAIMKNSKPIFFVTPKSKDMGIPYDELFYEQKAEIITNMECYFYKLTK